MPARWIAVLIGASLGCLVFFAGWRLCHPPTPMQEIEVHASDARGQPVTQFGWTIVDETPGAMLYAFTRVEARPGGVARVQVPSHEITLEIESPGLHRARLGPFQADAIPSKLEATLEDLGVVEGLITRDGKPVPGAAVGLFRAGWKRWNDEPSGLFYGYAGERAETDVLGAFRIKSDSDGVDLWVRAWKEGSASGTTGPVRLGALPIQVELHEGGSLEGRLRRAPGREIEGCGIELYREVSRDEREPGTFERFLAPVATTGAFEFRHVDPGPWLVRLSPAQQLSSSEGVPFHVAIEEHQTRRLEMDLTQPPLELVANLTMNGRPWSPAWAALYSLGEKALCLDSAEADSKGTWRLRTRAPGRYQLFIVGNHQHDISVPARAWCEVDLQRGETLFERSLNWSKTDSPDMNLDQNR